jgi:hypothetical protein
MSWGGWILMIGTVTALTGLLVGCLVKVLRTPDATRHLHAPPDIDTADGDDRPRPEPLDSRRRIG